MGRRPKLLNSAPLGLKAEGDFIVSKGVKILLAVVAVIVVLSVAAVLAGVYYVSKYVPQVVEGGKKSQEEGVEFGKGTDNEGCLAESLRRHKTSKGFGELLGNNLFLGACLGASRPVEGFCEGVPASTEFTRTVQWRMERCRAAGITDSQCGNLFGQVQQYCDNVRRAGTN